MEVCPICKVHVKVDEAGKFIQHQKYLAQQGIWVANTVCKKSGKKA